MATLQYIGARYVPKFYQGPGSVWTDNTAYEAMTIVVRNTNLYISKIPVPSNAGAPESHPNYWASIGVYNANVAQINADIASLDRKIDDVDTAYKAADTVIEGSVTQLGLALADESDRLEDMITSLRGAVGTPLKASTAAQMTDTSKIYVYTGSEAGYVNGNWYYYTGGSWVSGGVYNSAAVNTDTTLTVPGMPADAKATGDIVLSPFVPKAFQPDYTGGVFDFDENFTTGSTYFYCTVGNNRTIAHGPDGVTVATGVLENVTSASVNNYVYCLQRVTFQEPAARAGEVWYRYFSTYTKQVFIPWTNEIKRDAFLPAKQVPTPVNGIIDLNTVTDTGAIYLNETGGTYTIAHAPAIFDNVDLACIVNNIPMYYSVGGRIVLQEMTIQSPIGFVGQVFRRLYNPTNNSVYVDWVCEFGANQVNNVVIFGDSISAGYPATTNDYYKWWWYLKKYWNISNYTESGAGILYQSGGQNMKTFADSFNDSTANYLVMFMGTNDYGNNAALGTPADATSAATVCGALKYSIEKVLATVPSISIIGVLPINRSREGSSAYNWAYGTANTAGYTLSDLCDTIAQVYANYGIPVVDFRQGPFQKLNLNTLLSDGLHPTLMGYRKITHYLGGHLHSMIEPL